MANSSQNSIDYYREREGHELNLAETAASQAIRNIHLEMARSYGQMVAELEDGPSARRDTTHTSSDPTATVG